MTLIFCFHDYFFFSQSLLPDYQRLLSSTPSRRLNTLKLIENSGRYSFILLLLENFMNLNHYYFLVRMIFYFMVCGLLCLQCTVQCLHSYTIRKLQSYMTISFKILVIISWFWFNSKVLVSEHFRFMEVVYKFIFM